MKKYYEIKYNTIKNWISDQIDSGKDKDDIHGGFIDNPGTFLKIKNAESNWDINEEDWDYLVDYEWDEAEKRQEIIDIERTGTLFSPNEDNALKIPTGSKSSWIKYKKMLEEKGYSTESIRAIEKDSFAILKKLSTNLEQTGPIRGLVIGNVQSGKTANMAALMAMASEYGWNTFVVLSGMIENLRKQTEKRLFEELNQTNGDVTWDLVERPTLKNKAVKVPTRMNFRGPQRYMTIVLKNKTILENLLDWISSDKNKMEQMKILIIDDESDQASVNTSDTTVDERKAINKLLVNFVNGKNKNGKDLPTKYGAMNYVGYTATPYANILSETAVESLYPRDFISMLSKSNEYIGPQEIFGVQGSEKYEGLDMVRILDDHPDSDEIQRIIQIHNGESNLIPQKLKDSIAYFIAASASLRLYKFKSPVSMLIHTSNLRAHHDRLSDAIQYWLNNFPEEVIKLSETIWEQERKNFTKSEFKSSYPNYGGNLNEGVDMPEFYLIEDMVKEVMSEVSHIKVKDSVTYEYHKGIHICVDNSSHNSITSDDEHVRLYYPKSKEEQAKTPVFLVVGGTTLSRGLTLEGLITTYFLRSSGAADTLMQMGRWFGYRKGYELYPRIWLSKKAYVQFEYISQVDFNLREEIVLLNKMGHSFNKVAPKIMNSPQNVNLKVTSSNKSRGAIAADYDFMGASIQTTIFDNNVEVLEHNIEVAERFLESLGQPLINTKGNRSVYWTNVNYKRVTNFLGDFQFNTRTRSFNAIDQFNDWVISLSEEKKLQNWNVIAVGKGDINIQENNWVLENFSWNKISRTRKKTNIESDDLIRIQTLRGPSDLYRDIDLSTVKDDELRSMIMEGKTQNYIYVREQLGLELTPQLFIYKIDGNSKVVGISETREDLAAVTDIIGIYISIPGGKRNEDYIAHLTIKVESSELNTNDLEGENYDEY